MLRAWFSVSSPLIEGIAKVGIYPDLTPHPTFKKHIASHC